MKIVCISNSTSILKSIYSSIKLLSAQRRVKRKGAMSATKNRETCPATLRVIFQAADSDGRTPQLILCEKREKSPEIGVKVP